MSPSDSLSLLTLGALWGASFLFMRIAVAEFGPVPLIALRLIIATVALLPILLTRERLSHNLRRELLPLTLLGLLNSAIPFCLLAYATLHLTAGFAAILNSTAPFFAAIVAYVWLRQRLSKLRVLGLLVGFAGVVILVWGRASFKPGGGATAIIAGLAAAFCYGLAANYAKVKLPDLSPLRVTTLSMATSTLCLLPLALYLVPAKLPTVNAFLAVTLLALFSTAFAYLLYYRLINRVGPTRSIAVTFLIPVFGMLWGYLFLHEPLTPQLLLGTATILSGTALTTGLIAGR